MKRNLTIIIGLFLVLGSVFFVGFVVPVLLNVFFYVPYVKSALILLIFTIIVFSGRMTWEKNVMLVIAIFTILGTFMDTAGNPIYNKPLEWMVSSMGKVEIETNVYSYAPGEYSITDHLRITKKDGQVLEVHTIFLYLYRFVQYLGSYIIVAALLQKPIKRMADKKILYQESEEELSDELKQKIEEEKKRRQKESEKQIVIPQEIQEAVLQLIRKNNKIKAIKLVHDYTGLSISDAKALVQEMEEFYNI